jgi:YYY domain-containing protein
MDFNRPAFAYLLNARRWKSVLVALALLGIVLVAAYFRMLNLSAWDGHTGMHPDERFMHHTVAGLSVPRDWRTYFVSRCPDPMLAPRNPYATPQEWEPSAESGCSTLNPRNFNWSRGYVYGTLPTTLTRVVTEALGRTDTQQIVITGRILSAGADLITLIATFFLASLVYNRWVGLLAAALYAGAVMPIQQAHYFTVDHFAVSFGTLALLFITRLSLRGSWTNAVWLGVFIGAAVASKINMAAMVVLVPMALLLHSWRRLRPQAPNVESGLIRQQMLRAGLLLLLAAIVTFVAFRIFQPDAFSGPNIWDIAPELRFLERLTEARLTASGEVDLPSSHQWAGRTPWFFPWQNMVLWGMGLPLGIAAWLGWAAAGIEMLRRRTLHHLIPWVWITLYFGWQGGQFVTTMRYFLPLYPPLIMFGAWGLLRLVDLARQERGWFIFRLERWLNPSVVKLMALGALVLVIGTTLSWAWAYTRIYTHPYTRVAAAEWIEQTAPQGAVTTWELWDDPLPFSDNGRYQQITTHPYAEEEISKYLGGFDVNQQQADADGLINQLARADFVVLTSPRVYESVARVPERFPVILRYYQALFDGSLGFELAADIHSFPSLGSVPINDMAAEEAFWVYDHPRVLIFRRTADFDPQRAHQILLDGVNWNTIYRGLRPAQVSQAPTTLQLIPTAWEKLQSVDTRYLFSSRLGWIGSLGVWIVAIELLGLAAAGLIWRLNLSLPERGLGLGRVVGLAFFALPLALLGTTQLIGISRVLIALWYGLLLGFGIRMLWRDRHEIMAYVRGHSWLVGTSQALYGVALVAGLWLYSREDVALLSHLLARWAALLRAPTLPPPDLFFVGGHDPLPYAAQLPFALLNKLLGVESVIGLNLALVTALALALVSLWHAVSSRILTAVLRQWRAAGLLWFAISLVIVGVGGALIVYLSRLPWQQTSIRQDLDVLGLAMLVATILAIGVGVLNDRRRWSGWLLLLPLLAFVRGYGDLVMAAILLTLTVMGWVGLRGSVRSWLWRLALLLGMALVGHGFAWSVAPAPLQALPLDATGLLLLSGLLVPLGLLTSWAVVCGYQLAGPRGLLVVAGVVIAAVLSAIALGMWVVLPVMLLPGCAWLAFQFLLPGIGPKRWYSGAIWAYVTLALGLAVITVLVSQGTLRGDDRLLLLIAVLLLIFAAGQALPILRNFLRRHEQSRQPVLIGGVTGVLVLVALLASWSPAYVRAGETFEDLAAPPEVSNWLTANVSGTPVLVGAPQSVAAMASTSGLPALIASPQAEQQLRDILQPSVGGVINARLEAISDIYSGDIVRAQQSLQTYQVEYILLSEAEQAAFPNAILALQTLAEDGLIEPIYEQNGVQIYRHVPSAIPPSFVAQPVALEPPSTKTLLLDQPVNQLPVVDEYGWNRLATQYPALGVGLWLLLLQGLGLLALPLTSTIFQRWHDHGWVLSKLIGLLIWGYVVWLTVSLGWWNFDRWALLWGALVVAGLSAFAIWYRRRYMSGCPMIPPLGILLRTELCLLLAWGLWALVRAANPDVWHPIYGGEKPFEFGFLNAVLRSPVLPPYDPFFSDGIVNYYYYGLYLIALLIKATGIAPAVGFNLAIATIFAFAVTAALTLGREITGRWRYGLLVILLLVGIGPVASIVAINESRGLEPVLEALGGGLSGFSTRLGAWFWGPSRIIPYTINEFPLFAFLFADLHPHLIALPITLLALACVVELGQRRWTPSLLALSALVLGTLAVANSWDAPTYALLIGGALVIQSWCSARGKLAPAQLLLRLGTAALLAIGVLVIGLALYAPFFAHYRAMVGGVGLVQHGDRIHEWLLWFGPLLLIAATLIGTLAWASLHCAAVQRPAIARIAGISIPLLIAALMMSGWAMQDSSTGWPLRLLLALLGGIGLSLLFLARLRSATWLPLWIITVGLLVALGTQLVFVRDHLVGGTHERMNTVFKFGFQIWTLWAIGAATAMPVIVRLLRRFEVGFGIWIGLMLVVLAPGVVYPLAGIPSRLGTRFDPAMPLTFDGFAFMEHARYSHEDRLIDLRPDAEAIEWLNQNIVGTPVFLTSEREFYRAYGMRIAANTGLPMVLGRLHQDEQRPPSQVQERDHDIQTLLNTSDLQTTLRLLAKYHVDYVYIGPVERAFYDPAGVAKWETLRGTALELVYENDGVRIYRVDSNALTDVDPSTLPPPVVFNDVQTQALEAHVSAHPDDSGAAFSLGQRYVQLGRLEDAARVLEAAAQSHSEDVPLYHFLGDVLAQLGRDDEAVAAWSHAAEVQRTPSNLNKLGQGLIELRRWDDAEQALNEALSLDPTFADAYFFLGELYRSRAEPGDREQAIIAYQRHLQSAPSDALWRNQAEAYLSELDQ